MSHTDYDAIVIGSGAGGLTTALCLAQAGLQVLVCEQHEIPGGWCQSFTLEGYRFSPGVHYLGGLEPGGSLNNVYRGLGVSQDLEFEREAVLRGAGLHQDPAGAKLLQSE